MGCLTKHIGREQKVIGKLRRGPVWMMAADFWRMAPCLHFCQMAADAATQLLCSRPQRDLGIQQKLTKNAPTPASISKLNKSWSQNQRRDHAGCIYPGHRVGTTVSLYQQLSWLKPHHQKSVGFILINIKCNWNIIPQIRLSGDRHLYSKCWCNFFISSV